MGAFPSGQRGQTVNLLSLTSVVRIHPLPPKSRKQTAFGFFICAARRNSVCPQGNFISCTARTSFCFLRTQNEVAASLQTLLPAANDVMLRINAARAFFFYIKPASQGHLKCTQKFRQELNIKSYSNELGIEPGSFLLV